MHRGYQRPELINGDAVFPDLNNEAGVKNL